MTDIERAEMEAFVSKERDKYMDKVYKEYPNYRFETCYLKVREVKPPPKGNVFINKDGEIEHD